MTVHGHRTCMRMAEQHARIGPRRIRTPERSGQGWLNDRWKRKNFRLRERETVEGSCLCRFVANHEIDERCDARQRAAWMQREADDMRVSAGCRLNRRWCAIVCDERAVASGSRSVRKTSCGVFPPARGTGWETRRRLREAAPKTAWLASCRWPLKLRRAIYHAIVVNGVATRNTTGWIGGLVAGRATAGFQVASSRRSMVTLSSTGRQSAKVCCR